MVVCGSNPKDAKSPAWFPPQNFGDDIAGYVEAVGAGVLDFRPGDRVAAFHEMFTPHGAFAEYAISWDYTTFRLPDKITFEEGATIPLTAMTAALGLYRDLRLPNLWTTDEDRPETGPLVIYGAGAAVGAFAVQLARKSGIHPIICVAGQSKDHVETLIDQSRGDVVVDYRAGSDATISSIRKALDGKPLLHAFDAVADHGSDKIIGALLEAEKSRVTMVNPKDRTRIPKTPGVPFTLDFALPPLEGMPEGVEAFWTAVGSVHGSYKEFGFIFFRWLAYALENGLLKHHPYEVIPGGLDGLENGLARLLNGKAHAIKYVYKIGETEGVIL